jgi:YYY domain-containing protein
MLTEIIIWYALILVIGMAAFPIVSIVCKNISDRGYCISKIAGILILSYLAWLLSYPLSFSRETVLLALAILCALSLLCIIYGKSEMHIKRDVIIRNEIVFFVAFIVFLAIRVCGPEIVNFGEKFMDFAFLNAVMRSSHFPPHDPWFAGGLLDFYYYFGYLTVAVPSKISGISTAVTYNLGLVTLAALAANAAFGIGYDLTKKIGYGIWTMIFVVFIANAHIVFDMAARLLNLGTGSHEHIFGLWESTRIIPDTINEFPYFSFTFGDLHPHVISIPFQLLVLVLMLNIHRSDESGITIYGTGWIRILAGMILSALAIGVLFPMNVWDYPTYLIIFASIVLVQQYHAASLRNAPVPIATVAILSILLFMPFYLDFQGAGASGAGIGIVYQNTLLIDFIEIFALFLFLIFSFLFLHSDLDRRYVVALIPIAALSLILFRTLIITIPLTLLCIHLLFHEDGKSDRFVMVLVLTGSLLAIFCEIFYLDDHFGAPNERMNTVFKLYLQIWILWGIAAGYCLYRSTSLLNRRSSRNIGNKTIWIVFFCILFASCGICSLTITAERISLDHNPRSLDGTMYLNLSDRGEYLAISWIRREIAGTPVILEAPGRNSYSTDSRVSAFTGLPTLIGWRWHEIMWGRGWDEIRPRVNDADTIYSTHDIPLAIDLLDKYNVSYIYIGAAERERYDVSGGPDKFDDEDYFECVYIGSVRIYRLKGGP